MRYCETATLAILGRDTNGICNESIGGKRIVTYPNHLPYTIYLEELITDFKCAQYVFVFTHTCRIECCTLHLVFALCVICSFAIFITNESLINLFLRLNRNESHRRNR